MIAIFTFAVMEGVDEMKAYILDHLSDLAFDHRLCELHDTLGQALTELLDKWISEGVIDEEAKKKMLTEWEDDRWNLFNNTIG